eukprot:TRINITY_DN1262_c0_g2_i7.p2 TRINITY_DN1262_c0_g2~~TRINITY_DN1262_c0_g2_i7.p2  ORF type:complete len:196 (-),score=-24.97 TRINITY_DN1262_c0_g2_i7:891-1478(-)
MVLNIILYLDTLIENNLSLSLQLILTQVPTTIFLLKSFIIININISTYYYVFIKSFITITQNILAHIKLKITHSNKKIIYYIQIHQQKTISLSLYNQYQHKYLLLCFYKIFYHNHIKHFSSHQINYSLYSTTFIMILHLQKKNIMRTEPDGKCQEPGSYPKIDGNPVKIKLTITKFFSLTSLAKFLFFCMNFIHN